MNFQITLACRVCGKDLLPIQAVVVKGPDVLCRECWHWAQVIYLNDEYRREVLDKAKGASKIIHSCNGCCDTDVREASK